MPPRHLEWAFSIFPFLFVWLLFFFFLLPMTLCPSLNINYPLVRLPCSRSFVLAVTVRDLIEIMTRFIVQRTHMTSSEQHNVSQTSSEKNNDSQGTKRGNDRKRQRKIFLVYQTAACYPPKAEDQFALGKLYKCSPILPPLFSCISSKIDGEPPDDCATSWHCCLLLAAFFRAHLADMGLQYPRQLVEDLPKSCWPWLQLVWLSQWCQNREVLPCPSADRAQCWTAASCW